MQPDKSSPQLNEAVWKTWVKKNKAQDRFRYERRVKAMALAMVFAVVSGLLWKFIG